MKKGGRREGMEHKLTRMQVGEHFEVFQPGAIMNGGILEILHDKGLMLVLYMQNMRKSEEQAIRKSKIHVRTIKEWPNMLMLIRFASPDNLIFEISFDAGLYSDERRNYLGETNLLQIVGVESTNNTIRAMRLVSIPRNLLATMVRYWSPSTDKDHFARYRCWIDNLYARYTTMQLWNMAEYTGQLGEF